MKRVFVGGLTVTAVGVLVVVILGVLLSRTEQRDDRESAFVACPSSAPDACASRLADKWGGDAHRIPSIALPAGFRYDRGFITKNERPPAGYFVFQTTIGADTRPSEITLRVSPASSVAFDASHRGGTLHHLPSGRPYLDGSKSPRSGPFIERVGNFEFVVSYVVGRSPDAPRAAQLQLLDSVTEPSSSN
ncbi:MAG TPA: hypothetical protein VIK54_07055 [Acidimicrobiia bacterium]